MPDLRSLLNSVLECAAVRGVLQAVTTFAPGAGAPVILAGLTSSAKALVVAGLAHQVERPLVVVTADNETAANLNARPQHSMPGSNPGRDRRY